MSIALGEISEFHYVTNDINLGPGKFFGRGVRMAIFSIFQLWSQFSQKGAPLWQQNYFLPSFPPKRSLGIEGFKKIKFHYPTPDPDSGIQCVKFANIEKKRLRGRIRNSLILLVAINLSNNGNSRQLFQITNVK